jgi:hypothetical protein
VGGGGHRPGAIGLRAPTQLGTIITLRKIVGKCPDVDLSREMIGLLHDPRALER